jgi:hypothetical protein
MLHCNEKPTYVFLFWKFARPQSQFSHSCVSERFISSQDQSTYFLQQNRQIDRWTICINRSQTHECGNWDCGGAVPILGIVSSNVRYWFFAVYIYELSFFMSVVFFFLRQIAMLDSSVLFNILHQDNINYRYSMIINCAWRISSALQDNNDDNCCRLLI